MKGFGCRPLHDGRARLWAGVRKPPGGETAVAPRGCRSRERYGDLAGRSRFRSRRTPTSRGGSRGITEGASDPRGVVERGDEDIPRREVDVELQRRFCAISWRQPVPLIGTAVSDRPIDAVYLRRCSCAGRHIEGRASREGLDSHGEQGCGRSRIRVC